MKTTSMFKKLKLPLPKDRQDYYNLDYCCLRDENMLEELDGYYSEWDCGIYTFSAKTLYSANEIWSIIEEPLLSSFIFEENELKSYKDNITPSTIGCVLNLLFMLHIHKFFAGGNLEKLYRVKKRSRIFCYGALFHVPVVCFFTFYFGHIIKKSSQSSHIFNHSFNIFEMQHNVQQIHKKTKSFGQFGLLIAYFMYDVFIQSQKEDIRNDRSTIFELFDSLFKESPNFETLVESLNPLEKMTLRIFEICVNHPSLCQK